MGQQLAKGTYSLIPGAVAYDNMRANWAAGNKGSAVANGITWVGEQALFVFSLGQSMTVQAGPRVITTTVEDTVSLFHKGELLNGEVSSTRSLSTGLDFDSVNALNRPGQVFQFNVPRSMLRGWELDGQAARFLDFDAMTGVQNAEMRIYAPTSGQLNQYIVPLKF